MIVVDSHLDLAWNALIWNRDLTLPVEEIRRAEADLAEHRRGANTVCFPEMRKGNVAICLATVLARCTSLNDPQLDWRTQEAASAMGHGQRTFYRIMEERGQMRMLRNPHDIQNHVEAWCDGSRNAIGYILSMEGADPILSPDDAATWWEKGLRVVGLTHYGSGVYGDGTSGQSGLTPKGFELLKAFAELGMIVDTTHLTDKGFWQVMESFQGRVLASHNNCRALVPGDRQYSDDQLRAIVARDAVIGAVFDAWMLVPDWKISKPNTATLESAVDQIDHICQLAGNARHVAIGSDLDGGYGTEQSPIDLDTIADLQKLTGILRSRGYSEPDIEGIFHRNWMRFFEGAWNRN